MNIILIGFKNCGKTTIGKMLASTLNYKFVDTDILLEKYYFVKKAYCYLTRRYIIKKAMLNFAS